MSWSTTKPTKWSLHPVKTQISLGIRYWVFAPSEDSDQPGHPPLGLCTQWRLRSAWASAIGSLHPVKTQISLPSAIGSLHPMKNQISLGICPVRSESSLSAWKRFGSLATLKAYSRLWSDWVDVQAYPSLRWAQKSSCWICYALINFLLTYPDCLHEAVLQVGCYGDIQRFPASVESKPCCHTANHVMCCSSHPILVRIQGKILSKERAKCSDGLYWLLKS